MGNLSVLLADSRLRHYHKTSVLFATMLSSMQVFRRSVRYVPRLAPVLQRKCFSDYVLPGRLGTPDMCVETDPRVDSRQKAELIELQMHQNNDGPPITVDAPLKIKSHMSKL